MKNSKIFVLVFLFISLNQLHSQSTDKYAPLHGDSDKELKLYYSIQEASNSRVDDSEKAIKKLKKIAQKYPENLYAKFNLGICYFYTKNYTQTSISLNEVILADKFRYQEEALYMSGISHLLNKNYKLAIELLKKYNQNSRYLWAIIGTSYLKLKKKEMAYSFLSRSSPLYKFEFHSKEFESVYLNGYAKLLLDNYRSNKKIKDIYKFCKKHTSDDYVNKERMELIKKDACHIRNSSILRAPSYYGFEVDGKWAYVSFGNEYASNATIFTYNKREVKAHPYHVIESMYELQYGKDYWKTNLHVEVIDNEIQLEFEFRTKNKENTKTMVVLKVGGNSLYDSQGNKLIEIDLSKKEDECLIGDCGNGIGIKRFSEYIISGEFKNGKAEGTGRAEYYNGNSYEGEFKNGKKHGLGVYVMKVNNLDYISWKHKNQLKGEFYEDEFVGEKELKTSVIALNTFGSFMQKWLPPAPKVSSSSNGSYRIKVSEEWDSDLTDIFTSNTYKTVTLYCSDSDYVGYKRKIIYNSDTNTYNIEDGFMGFGETLYDSFEEAKKAMKVELFKLCK